MPLIMKLIALILLNSSVIGEARKLRKTKLHYHTGRTRRRPNLSYPSPKGCNRECGSIFSQVCGSNGRTYNKRCLLELDACERDTTIQVVREGSCIAVFLTPSWGLCFFFADILSGKGNIGGSGGNSFVLVNLICLISRAAANPRLLD